MWMQVTGYSGDFHQIIRYSASGFCLDENVTRRKVQKTLTQTHEHTSWRTLIYLRFFSKKKRVKNDDYLQNKLLIDSILL